MTNTYERIVKAATDVELPFIEAAAERAGIIWRCSARRISSQGLNLRCCWVNLRARRRCENCGERRGTR